MPKFDGLWIGAAAVLVAGVLDARAVAAGPATTQAAVEESVAEVTVAQGRLAGTVDLATGVRSFKGVPFAAPPVGDLRWKPPQPPAAWDGVRAADHFGPRPMQQPLFSDMAFRSPGVSEDCLYLNVWAPAATDPSRAAPGLPVLVYFYGGGFVAGDSSETRYDGQSMAARGIVSVTVNYRLGVFGFLAHPALTSESDHHASGNYALLDQRAALQWVHDNAAAFGGDPARVTIAGESAGSMSVSAQMASPLSKGLFAGAIGESGSVLASLPPAPLADAEAAGVAFAAGLGLGDAPTLAALRAVPADRLVKVPAKQGSLWRKPTVDGYFFPKPPVEIYAAGEQSHVPLLAGTNSEESGSNAVLGNETPTADHYRQALRRLYGDKADAVLAAYPAATDADVPDAARELACDRFISYGTWKWADLATRTGGKPTYYYLFVRTRPAQSPGSPGAPAPGSPPPRGAVHSAEIQYALGNLGLSPQYAWTADDERVSAQMQAYFVNFIKTADPNGPGLAAWPTFGTGRRMVLDVESQAQPCKSLRPRYELLGSLPAKP